MAEDQVVNALRVAVKENQRLPCPMDLVIHLETVYLSVAARELFGRFHI